MLKICPRDIAIFQCVKTCMQFPGLICHNIPTNCRRWSLVFKFCLPTNYTKTHEMVIYGNIKLLKFLQHETEITIHVNLSIYIFLTNMRIAPCAKIILQIVTLQRSSYISLANCVLNRFRIPSGVPSTKQLCILLRLEYSRGYFSSKSPTFYDPNHQHFTILLTICKSISIWSPTSQPSSQPASQPDARPNNWFNIELYLMWPYMA